MTRIDLPADRSRRVETSRTVEAFVADDFAEAWRYSALADPHDERVLYVRGYCLHFGRGCERNLVRAAECYREAAMRGSSFARFWLGQILERGEGVEQDFSAALDLYREAARAGVLRAMRRLGDLVVKGVDVGLEDVETEQVLVESAAWGNAAAAAMLKRRRREARQRHVAESHLVEQLRQAEALEATGRRRRRLSRSLLLLMACGAAVAGWFCHHSLCGMRAQGRMAELRKGIRIMRNDVAVRHAKLEELESDSVGLEGVLSAADGVARSVAVMSSAESAREAELQFNDLVKATNRMGRAWEDAGRIVRNRVRARRHEGLCACMERDLRNDLPSSVRMPGFPLRTLERAREGLKSGRESMQRGEFDRAVVSLDASKGAFQEVAEWMRTEKAGLAECAAKMRRAAETAQAALGKLDAVRPKAVRLGFTNELARIDGRFAGTPWETVALDRVTSTSRLALAERQAAAIEADCRRLAESVSARDFAERAGKVRALAESGKWLECRRAAETLLEEYPDDLMLKALSGKARRMAGFERARKMTVAGRWHECQDETDRLLAAWPAEDEKGREELAALRRNALDHIEPSAKIVAELDGREISNATVTVGGVARRTPFVLNHLEPASEIGGFVLKLERNGWSTRPRTFAAKKVDWEGPRVLKFKFAADDFPQEVCRLCFKAHGDQPSARFCPHCGAPVVRPSSSE